MIPEPLSHELQRNVYKKCHALVREDMSWDNYGRKILDQFMVGAAESTIAPAHSKDGKEHILKRKELENA